MPRVPGAWPFDVALVLAPRITGAVPESEREGVDHARTLALLGGVYGIVERVLAAGRPRNREIEWLRMAQIWHSLLGSFAAAVLLLMSFSRHMADDYTFAVLTGEQLESDTVILGRGRPERRSERCLHLGWWCRGKPALLTTRMLTLAGAEALFGPCFHMFSSSSVLREPMRLGQNAWIALLGAWRCLTLRSLRLARATEA